MSPARVVIPLCPVYGLGALAVLSLPALLLRRPLLVFLAGALVATLVEYVVAVFYEKGVGVRFYHVPRAGGYPKEKRKFSEST